MVGRFARCLKLLNKAQGKAFPHSSAAKPTVPRVKVIVWYSKHPGSITIRLVCLEAIGLKAKQRWSK